MGQKWDKLIENATVCRVYGEIDVLRSQYTALSAVYAEIDRKIPEADKWLKICSKPKLYTGKEVILRLALASFVKSLLEATAETIGSVIKDLHRQGQLGDGEPIRRSICGVERIIIPIDYG